MNPVAPLEATPSVAAGFAAMAAPPALAQDFSALLQGLPQAAPTAVPVPPVAAEPRPALSARLPPRPALGLSMDSSADLPWMADAPPSSQVSRLPALAAGLRASESPPCADQATAPEPFLQWLAAIKPPGLPQPPAAESPLLALPEITAAVAGALPAGVLAASTEGTMLERLSAMPASAISPAPPLPLPNPSPLIETQPAALLAAATVGTSTRLALDRPDWPQQLGEQIQWRLGEGVQEARIEISPRELGAVQLHLSMDESGLRVHLSAAHAETRALLQQELPRLRDVLQQGGVQLADAQVGRETQGQPQGRHAAPAAARGQRDDAAERAVAKPGSGWRLRRGLLDDYA